MIKEPWEMTRDEWYNAKDALKSNYADQSSRGHYRSMHEAIARIEGLERLLYGVKPVIDPEFGAQAVDHRQVIEKALSEGMPVPGNVLEEYSIIKR